MKNSFLNKLAEELYTKYSDSVGELCVVFPSRRAGLFFRKYLSELADKPIWSPDIYGIQQLIAELSPYTIEDKLLLVFELYELYKKFVPEDSFDKFYPWGEMMLNDFDDIDKNLVPADGLFRIIKETREIEESFELNFGDYEEFQKFWGTFSARKLSDAQKDFIKTWEILGEVYASFRKLLAEKNIAYEGMAYRRLYEEVKSGKFKSKWKKIIFAGFNELNKSETEIIKHFIKKDIADIYWDADEYYVNDEKQEAGIFLRRNFRDLEINEPKWIGSGFSKDEKKNIKIIGSSMQSGEVKSLGAQLKELAGSSGELPENTAIVLPDESMLIPLLYSLPAEASSLNVTMGYPFRNSSLFSFVGLLKDLQLTKKGKDANPVFYHKNVTGLLLHPYLKMLTGGASAELVRAIAERNMVYVSANFIYSGGADIYKSIFKSVEGVDASVEYVYSLLRQLSEGINSVGGKLTDFENEFFFELFTQMNRLSGIINKFGTEFTTETFWRLLLEVLMKIKVPFSGEPLSGLQIMGLLETRSLDFDNVFILSMNEGTMPRGASGGSIIPYSLRKSFRLPTFENEDASSAYYFYRLMQKAKNVYLFYNTEPGQLSGGEKSRYIMQIENELANRNKNIKISSHLLQLAAGLPAKKEITIAKSADIIDKLKLIPQFSATGFTSYITCPLKFYLERVTRIKEDDDIEESFGGATFGHIFHEVMKSLYHEHIGKMVNPVILRNLMKKLEEQYDDILAEAFESVSEKRSFAAELEGRNLLYKGIIKKLAGKILEIDLEDAPFEIVELEGEFTSELSLHSANQIKLLGRIDRIDRKDGTIRIIDYKTGKVSATVISEKNFESMFTNPDYKESFQTFFYSMLYLKDNPKSRVTPAIFPLRNINNGLKYVNDEPVTTASITEFERGLKNLAEEIFDPSVPFTQTPDSDRCVYCSFKELCYRS